MRRAPRKGKVTRALLNSCHTQVVTPLSHTIPLYSGPLTPLLGPSDAHPVQTHSCSFIPEQRITLAKAPFSFFPHPALSIWNLHLSHRCHKFSFKPLLHHFLTCTLWYTLRCLSAPLPPLLPSMYPFFICTTLHPFPLMVGLLLSHSLAHTY